MPGLIVRTAMASDPNHGHPNDPDAVRAHLLNSALTLSEHERAELLDELNRQIDVIDSKRAGPEAPQRTV